MNGQRLQDCYTTFVDGCMAGVDDRAREWLTSLDRVIAETVAPAAAEVDRSSVHPEAALEALRAIGVFGVQIPATFGGLGFDNGVAALVLERVAQACASTAAILMFHYQVVNRTMRFVSEQRRVDDLTALASHALGASAWTEPLAGKDKANLQTRLTRDGWVTGAKSFCTGLASASLIDVLLEAESADQSGATFVRISAKDPGVTVSEIYPMLGLRGTSTGTLGLARVGVAEPDIVGPVGSGRRLMAANHEAPLNPGILGLGVTMAAFNFAGRLCAGEVPGVPARHQAPLVARELANLAVEVEPAYVYAAHAIQRMVAGDAAAYLLGSKLKVLATRMAEGVTRRLLHVVGSRGFLSDFPLERHARDAQATSLMGPANDLCLDRVAQALLPIA